MLVIPDDLVVRSRVVRRALLVVDCEQARGRHDVWSGESSDPSQPLPQGDGHPSVMDSCVAAASSRASRSASWVLMLSAMRRV